MGESLWPYALDIYGRPDVEAILLELQDSYRQCVPFLLWAFWMAENGREVDDAALVRTAELARAWEQAAVKPLRAMRRNLKAEARQRTPHERLRHSVQALELEAERMLLQMLEEASPCEIGPCSARAILVRAVRIWGGDPPARLLTRLIGAAT